MAVEPGSGARHLYAPAGEDIRTRGTIGLKLLSGVHHRVSIDGSKLNGRRILGRTRPCRIQTYRCRMPFRRNICPKQASTNFDKAQRRCSTHSMWSVVARAPLNGSRDARNHSRSQIFYHTPFGTQQTFQHRDNRPKSPSGASRSTSDQIDKGNAV